MASVWGELKRRNVVRVAVAYAIVAWLLIEITATTFPILKLPNWSVTLVTVLVLIGFPLALILAWAFELTPEGIKKEKDVDRSESITHVTGRKLDFAIIGVLVIAVGFLLVDKLYLSEGDTAPDEIIATERKSIAVLPFVNMSDDPGNEYFSDGISEEILNLLVKVPELRVTSRSSAFSFKGQNLDVPTMAAKLNVVHVLEGSVRKSGNQLRITAQLIDGETDTHLWSETYDRELKDVFAIYDEIAAAVVDELKIKLLGEPPKATETNSEAYALYLQARHLHNQRTAESNRQAETLLKQALEIDPGFAPAWTELGSVYERDATAFGFRPVDEGNELARHAIQQALAIDPQYGPAYAILARIEMYYDWDFTAADQHMQQARALNSGDAAILEYAADLESIHGRIDEVIDLLRQSIALDPLSPQGHVALGATYYKAQRLEEAADSLQLALSLSPGRALAQHYVGLVLLAQGDAPAALVTIEQVTTDWLRLFGMAIVHHALGDAGASDAALYEFIDEYAAVAAYQVAIIYAFRGETDLAFEWLDEAYENRDSGLTQMLLQPQFANLHYDPRWTAFLDTMGLPH